MRPRFRKAGTDTSYDRRRGWRSVGRGAAATLLLACIVVIMAFVAAGASADTLERTAGTAPNVLDRSAGVSALRGEVGGPGSLPTFVPTVGAGASGAPGAGTIFHDGFEGSLSSWSVYGDPTWAFFTYRPFAGQWEAYCSGDVGGSLYYPPGPYFNNMSAWLVAGPFNLSAVTSATFQYKLNYITESNVDSVRALVSIDGDSFSGWEYSGNSQGWVGDSIDLTNVPDLGNVCGRSQVWIAFRFVSDSSVTYEGAYVDEVSITSGGGEVGLFLEGDQSVVPFAGRVNLTGELRDTSGSLVPNREVGLFWSQEDKIDGTWNPLDTYTSSTGQYSMGATNIQRLTYFWLIFAGDNQYSEGWSNRFKVMARGKLTPPAVPSRVRAGAKITSWGSLKPQHTAAQNKSSHIKLYVEHYIGGRWRLQFKSLYAMSYRNTPTDTKYSVTLRYAPGKWRIRAVHQDSDHAKTTSSWRSFKAN